MGGDTRNRFLILLDIRDGMYVAVDITKCSWDNGYIKPFTWREYAELEPAVMTTIIRGAGGTI